MPHASSQREVTQPATLDVQRAGIKRVASARSVLPTPVDDVGAVTAQRPERAGHHLIDAAALPHHWSLPAVAKKPVSVGRGDTANTRTPLSCSSAHNPIDRRNT